MGIPNVEMDKVSRKNLININASIDTADFIPHIISWKHGKSITSSSSGQTHRMSKFSSFEGSSE